MAKKKNKQEIAVKRPKIGETYRFNFAGSPKIGVLEEKNQKLSEHHNEPWFWFSSGGMRYPISIYDIIGVIKAEK